MLFVGLTGAVGAGKSEAARWFARMKVPVFSADRCVHDLLTTEAVKRRLLRRFGPEVLGRGGRVNRAVLARWVFASPSHRRWLEKLLHPGVRGGLFAWKAGLLSRARVPVLAVAEVPLLHEAGWARWFDGVLCVDAPEALRRRRLALRGWTPQQARGREKTQWSGARKARASDWVVSNNGSRATLDRRLRAWRRDVTARRIV